MRNAVSSPRGVLVLMVVLGAATYLVYAHTTHVFALLPFAVLLLCPLLHLFMHGGHGGHGGSGGHKGHH
jgi:hypothetical protein